MSAMRSQGWRARGVAALALLALASARAAAQPGSTLSMRGATGASEARLGWYLVIVSLVVIVVMAALVLAAALRGRRRRPGDEHAIAAEGSGLSWVMVGGVLVPAVILTATFLFTVLTLDAVAAPPRAPAATVRVVGHRWWWEVHYPGRSPADEAVTANEIHIPVGEPVRVELASADLIHSFWVPQLGGKTDAIPGQTNVTWMEAREPGVYYGRCGEYCGSQHAHMQLRVVAESPQAFRAWVAAQRQPAPPPATAAAGSGERAFMTIGCSLCHTIRGTPAGGAVGPDLTHLMSRRTIAGGTLPNTKATLAGWVTDAQALKPGSLMPTMAPGAQLVPLLSYLQTLR
ncbi:MAG TPA: cytochrome c oxidase subunit II [Gemmatimonadaceae bacterium]|nr:cytochrome c oxidase subunit II [Gemmatimonadaceae bacterium]